MKKLNLLKSLPKPNRKKRESSKKKVEKLKSTYIFLENMVENILMEVESTIWRILL